MALEIPTFLVRYGSNDRHTGRHTSKGMAETQRACQQLIVEGLGGLTLVLSPVHRPARITAGIIAGELGGELVRDRQARDDLALVSRHPHELDIGLDRFLEDALVNAGYSLDDHDNLVVVTRARLIGAARGMSPEESNQAIPHGSVYKYPPGSWPFQTAA